MKKLILLLLFIPLVSLGQELTTNDGTPLSELNVKYIIVSKAEVYNKNTVVSLDYGQDLTGKLNGKAIKINSKNAKFPSVLNVLNELKNYDVIQVVRGEYDIQYLLKYNK